MDDDQIRIAAYLELKKRTGIHGTTLPWSEITKTFRIGNEAVFLANRARGIFKPVQMQRGVLSLKSTMVREGREARYVDDRRDELLYYSMQGNDPSNRDNRLLREAFEDRSSFIYFHGVAPGMYEALWPAFISRWIPEDLKVEIEVGTSRRDASPQLSVNEEERRYRIQSAQQRIHQAAFREMILFAYDYKCALTGFPVKSLLHAAHIYPDRHELGAAKVTNGIAMSTLHHSAYDTNLIGIDPDGAIHVSERVSSLTDGPLLELGMKGLEGVRIRSPYDPKMKPDRDALAFRFAEYLAAQ